MQTNDQRFFRGINGKAVMLIHGITSGAAQMIPMARFLNDYGYSVRCVNLAGHGTYPEDLLHTSFEDFISKAEYDYQMLKNEFDTIFVGGLSTGGCLSLYLANRHTDIAGFVTLSAPSAILPGNFVSNEYPEDQAFFHRDMGGKEGLAKQYHIHYEEIAVRCFKELMKLIDIAKDPEFLSGITVPGIIIQAKNDMLADPKSAPYIYDHLGSKVKELYTPETGEHNIVLTEGRHEAFRRCAMFFETLGQ